VHLETDPHIHRTAAAIRDAGAKAGVALNPSTPIESLVDILEYLDFVVLMSVNPGFSGQSFIERVLDKLRRLDALRDERGLSFFVQVDGGVNAANAQCLVEAGADCLVAGNAVFKAPDPAAALKNIREAMAAGRMPKC
jgi:ribulose-phosphate 3-epimerase